MTPETIATAQEAAAWFDDYATQRGGNVVYDRYRDAINALVAEVQKINNPTIADAETRAKAAHSLMVKAETENRDLREQVRRLRENYDALLQNREILKRQNSDAAGVSLQKDADNRTLRDTIRRRTEERDALSEVASQAEREVVTLKQERDDLRVGMESMTETAEALRALLKTADKTADAKLLRERDTLQAELAAKERNLAAVEEQNRKHYFAWEQAQGERDTLQAELAKAEQRERDTLKAKLETRTVEALELRESLHREQDAHAKTRAHLASEKTNREKMIECWQASQSENGKLLERIREIEARANTETAVSEQGLTEAFTDRITEMSAAEHKAKEMVRAKVFIFDRQNMGEKDSFDKALRDLGLICDFITSEV